MGPIAEAGDIGRAVTGQVARIRRWTSDEFANAAPLWSDLLARSDANPLFMSWEWQWHWWSSHAARLDGELYLLAAFDTANKLVGLAPLYLHRGAHRGLFAARLESLGSIWRRTKGAFSEYLDFIVDRDHVDSVLEAVGDVLLADSRWTDLVFSNTRIDGHAARVFRDRLADVAYVRSVDPLVAHMASLPESFEEYVRTLDRSTRRRVWNHRKKLGGATLQAVAADQVVAAFDQLDQFHVHRWGRVHYVGVRRAFHERFAAAMARKSALRMSELRRDGRTISIMYNVRIGATEYNVQSGFDGVASRGISPGYLHFGYCIERACGEGVKGFDFLAGPGRRNDYKRDFATRPTRLATLQAIRSRPLAWLYRQYDRRRSGDSASTP